MKLPARCKHFGKIRFNCRHDNLRRALPEIAVTGSPAAKPKRLVYAGKEFKFFFKAFNRILDFGFFDAFGKTLLNMFSEQRLTEFMQSALRGIDLNKDVPTRFVVHDHVFQCGDLSLDAVQPIAQLSLVFCFSHRYS